MVTEYPLQAMEMMYEMDSLANFPMHEPVGKGPILGLSQWGLGLPRGGCDFEMVFIFPR